MNNDKYKLQIKVEKSHFDENTISILITHNSSQWSGIGLRGRDELVQLKEKIDLYLDSAE